MSLVCIFERDERDVSIKVLQDSSKDKRTNKLRCSPLYYKTHIEALLWLQSQGLPSHKYVSTFLCLILPM